MHRIRADAAPHCRKQSPESRVGWSQKLLEASTAARRNCSELAAPRRLFRCWTTPLLLHRAKRLVQCGTEGAIDRHHFARRLHLTTEQSICTRKLVEREAWQLHHDVVERRLKRRNRRPRHRVRNLAQRATDRDLRRDARDRVPRGLARKRRAAADSRVHLNHHVIAVVRRECELHVAPSLDAERADDVERGAAQPLMHGIGERLHGSNHDAIARVYTERINVLHRADRNARPL